MINIRAATSADRCHLIRMRLALQRHIEASNPKVWKTMEMGERWQAQQVDDMLNDKEGTVLIAEKDDGAIGFLYGNIEVRNHLTPSCVGFIRLIFVNKDYRKHGIGTNLIEEIVNYFKSNGVEEVSLNYILGNSEAEEFWNKLGFTPIRVSANTSLEALEKKLDKE